MALGEDQKRYIVAEITRQLEPTQSLLREIQKSNQENRDWQLGFWSNGSGKPPGFFQTRIKQDDDRYTALKNETEAQSETLENLKDFMKEQKLTRLAREAAEQEKKDRHKRYVAVAKWVAGVVGPLLLTFVLWLFHMFQPVLSILWQDYLKAHPYVSEQLKNRSSNDSDPSYARYRIQDERSTVE